MIKDPTETLESYTTKMKLKNTIRDQSPNIYFSLESIIDLILGHL
jgi:hypothetical protein